MNNQHCKKKGKLNLGAVNNQANKRNYRILPLKQKLLQPLSCDALGGVT